MSSGVACQCGGSRKVKMKNWKIFALRCNHSAFNGYHRAISDYSHIVCTVCIGSWRTKANYVNTLAFHPDGYVNQ